MKKTYPFVFIFYFKFHNFFPLERPRLSAKAVAAKIRRDNQLTCAVCPTCPVCPEVMNTGEPAPISKSIYSYPFELGDYNIWPWSINDSSFNYGSPKWIWNTSTAANIKANEPSNVYIWFYTYFYLDTINPLFCMHLQIMSVHFG